MEENMLVRWVRANNRRERAVSSRDDLPFTRRGQGIPLELDKFRKEPKGHFRFGRKPQ